MSGEVQGGGLVFERVAEAYDVVHAGRGKDYRAEAMQVGAEISGRNPAARTLLDVACGTGGHLCHFVEEYLTEGVDASAEMLTRAAAKAPGVVLHRGDMRTFDLGRRFDAVVCLFSSIGYLHPLEEMRHGVANMARYLNPGGVLVVEPWFAPGAWPDRELSADAGQGDGVAVARVTRSWTENGGRLSRMEMQWLIGRGDHIELEVELHALGLYTTEEYIDAFCWAGCTVDHDPHGLIGRGLLVGVPAA